MDERPAYHSYLLRLWQVKENAKVIWRASLQWVGSDERRNFDNLETMLVFLKDITDQNSEGAQEQDEDFLGVSEDESRCV